MRNATVSYREGITLRNRECPGDIGRPIGQIKPNIHCPDLEKMILEVIDTISVQTRDVKDSQGRTYSLTVRPYKNVDNRIDGAVLALFDIDDARTHQGHAQEAREYAEAIFNAVREPLVVLDARLRVQRVNPAFSSMFQMSEGDVFSTGKLRKGVYNNCLKSRRVWRVNRRAL